MKVLHVIDTLSAGGAELHLLTLARRLKSSAVEQSVAFLREHVAGSRSLRAQFEQEGIPVHDLKASSRYNLGFPVRLLSLVERLLPDILHTHMPRSDMGGALIHPFCRDITWISSVHDIYSNSWHGRWLLPCYRFVWPRADFIIAISHAVHDWLAGEHHVPESKIHTIHYGIEPGEFLASVPKRPVQKALEPRIGTIGRLEPRKGHEILIRAMPAVLQRFPGASLLIVGHDPFNYGGHLQRLIADLHLKDHVQMVGFCDHVSGFLREISVFAFATRSEGFGQVVIEAMLAGTPLVASRIPPLTEIVIDEENGLLVEAGNPGAFAEAICRVLSNPEEAAQMGLKARHHACEHFSAERMSQQTLALYQEAYGSISA